MTLRSVRAMLGKSRIDVGVWVIQSRSLDLSEVAHEAKASQWPLFVHTTSPTGQRSIGTEFRPAETSSLLRRCLLRPRPDLGPAEHRDAALDPELVIGQQRYLRRTCTIACFRIVDGPPGPFSRSAGYVPQHDQALELAIAEARVGITLVALIWIGA